ncbi:hypothetical protein [Ornithinimicrobium sp. INDO-MA30-4]|uniref:hypothetical protein n=1 Tax=Ornithinimicrobium sp. INDO-MA30-4 TaxID=2908651 RepID=UPI001F2941E9|nr:hypothetical protein [Ornithinimicrobium sp. INDO-MA30-4]UJH70024.1 hypothetical protein L0A91_12505 [Ornithinimicrobium sp. INDO-MA30-4]
MLLLTAAALFTAPEKSETQQQIETAEAALAEQSQGGPAPATTPPSDATSEQSQQVSTEDAVEADNDAGAARDDWDYSQDEDGLWVPSGEDITAIGDSLVVTSADGLTYRFPEMNYAAKSNRQWKDALAVVEQADADGVLRDNVILHFGTNAGVDADQTRAVLDALGADRHVVLMNLYGSSSFIPDSNDQLNDIAAKYPNVVIGDWQAAATAQPETLQSDRIHPDIDGMHCTRKPWLKDSTASTSCRNSAKTPHLAEHGGTVSG